MNGASPAGFRTFPKSWGADFTGAGEVRFRHWAPGEERLTLRLDGDDMPMSRTEDGWFELLATGIASGTPYAFVLLDGTVVPDPASRAQAGDVNGPSLAIDPTAYNWQNARWRGCPWEEAVIYELHVGAFTPEGTFAAAAAKLEHLADLGVTAVEIMPVAQFGGNRGWGYDGVLPYAPHRAYGPPEDMKALIDSAHGLDLMVLLDVVYNHFGPEGNYLSRYAPDFFDPDRHTPWGAAIAYEKEPVRRFFIENALYWLEEYALDGLRFDAIDQIRDPSPKHILVDIGERVRTELPERHIHLVTEDSRNITSLHERSRDGCVTLYTAEWNDDFHNVAHVVATGEREGYYADFVDDQWGKLARALAEGFAYQGERSAHAGGRPRGHPSAHLPPLAFVDFLQNHDQIGNRAFGERLRSLAERDMVEALSAILLLSPHVPLLFMGEEWGETRPFLFFTDFHGDLADAVREGRRREFAHFSAFGSEGESLRDVPDPNDPDTFSRSRIDWDRRESDEGREWFAFLRGLIETRRRNLLPLLRGAEGNSGHVVEGRDGIVAVDWHLGGGLLQLRANLAGETRKVPPFEGGTAHQQPAGAADTLARTGELPRRAVVFAVRAEPERVR